MKPLVDFIIPFKGLKIGMHQYIFDIQSDFFEAFESSPVKKGNFEIRLELDRRESMMVLEFDVKGLMHSPCDRCLEMIGIPVMAEQRLLVQFRSDSSKEDLDIVYLDSEAYELDISTYIYECICLSLPIQRLYDCASDSNPKCNFSMLKFMEGAEVKQNNPFKEALKDLNKLNDI